MISYEAIQYYADHPVEFTVDIIKAIPDDDQADIMNSVARNPMTTVRSGHGIGKSAVEAWLGLWFLSTRPFPKIPCTAPTKHQLYDILWAEFSKWIRGNPAMEQDIIWTQEKIYMRGHPEEWFAVARTATMPDALQGFHAEHVLYIIDEASGVSDKVFEPILGALSTEGAKLVMCGNPTTLSGFFYDSHHKNRALFSPFHIDGRNSARVSPAFIQTIIDMFGEDSDVFRVRVAGEFPKALPDSFIPLDWVEKASKKEPPVFYPYRIDIGVDVARFGDDDSVICPVFDKSVQQKPESYHHNDTMQLTGNVAAMVKRYAQEYPSADIHVKVDCDGLGVGVYDRLNEQVDQGKLPCTAHECHFGGAGGKISQDDPVEYANSTGIMWGTIHKGLYNETLTLYYHDQQIAQLSNRKYTINSDGEIVLERKEAMKKRGATSPDFGDALALALYEPTTSDYSLTF